MTETIASPAVLALAPRFSIGRTLSLSFSVLWRNLWRLSAVALTVATLRVAMEFYVPYTATGLLGAVVALVTFAMVAIPATVATLQHLRRVRPTFAGMLNGRLRRTLHVTIGAAILVFVASVPPSIFTMLFASLGIPEVLVALVIGIAAVYVLAILTMWFVAVPVLVAEDAGVPSSFRRSRYLTRGHRWAVLALVLVLAIIVVALTLLGTTLRLSLIAHAPAEMMLYPLSLTLIPTDALISLITAIIPAVAYHLLQAEREGASSDILARVFD